MVGWPPDWFGIADSPVLCQSSSRMVPLQLVALSLLASLLAAPLSETATAKPFQRCPYCDSSVFDYCSDKLLHDACCCLDPFEHQLPPQCKLADCSFLHANTCRDHHLITRCCCNKVFKI